MYKDPLSQTKFPGPVQSESSLISGVTAATPQGKEHPFTDWRTTGVLAL